MNRTAFRGGSTTSTILPLPASFPDPVASVLLDAARGPIRKNFSRRERLLLTSRIPPLLPTPVSLLELLLNTSDRRECVDCGVRGTEEFDTETEGDVERLASGLSCTASELVGFLSDERFGATSPVRRLVRLDADTGTDVEDTVRELRKGGRNRATKPLLLPVSDADAGPEVWRIRVEEGPRCGVRDVCSPMAICAIEGGCIDGFGERKGGDCIPPADVGRRRR